MTEEMLSVQSASIAFKLLFEHLTIIEALPTSNDEKYELLKRFILTVKQ